MVVVDEDEDLACGVYSHLVPLTLPQGKGKRRFR